MREAPSLEIIPALQKQGATISAYDPAGTVEAEKHFSDVKFASGPYLCVEGADALVFITEWNEFRALDLDRVHDLMRGNVVVDLRNIYDTRQMTEAGFVYTSVGRA